MVMGVLMPVNAKVTLSLMVMWMELTLLISNKISLEKIVHRVRLTVTDTIHITF